MLTTVSITLLVKSPAFGENDFIPREYSCRGLNVNPAIEIKGLPEETRSLALIMEDSDYPGTYNHWILWNLPPVEKIEEGSNKGVTGMNSNKEYKYTGPCPPAGETHHYHFKVYALDTELDLHQNVDKRILLQAMEGHTIATGEMTGLFRGE